MRVNVIIQPLFYAPFGKAFLHITRGDTLAQFRQKKRVVFATKQVAQIKPVLNPRHSVATNRQAALFAAFPHHPHFTRLQVEVFDIEPHQFGKTQTRAVHHFQHCPIAHGEGIVDINIQQPIHIIDVDVFRQMTWRFRCRNTFRRVSFEFVLADQPVKKAT